MQQQQLTPYSASLSVIENVMSWEEAIEKSQESGHQQHIFIWPSPHRGSGLCGVYYPPHTRLFVHQDYLNETIQGIQRSYFCLPSPVPCSQEHCDVTRSFIEPVPNLRRILGSPQPPDSSELYS